MHSSLIIYINIIIINIIIHLSEHYFTQIISKVFGPTGKEPKVTPKPKHKCIFSASCAANVLLCCCLC